MKTYMNCGLTGEQIADIATELFDEFFKEIVNNVDLKLIVKRVRDKHPEVGEESWKALEFDNQSISEAITAIKEEEFDKIFKQNRDSLVAAYTVQDDEDETEEE